VTALSVRAAAREAGDRTALLWGDCSWTWPRLASEVEIEIERLAGLGLPRDLAPVAFAATSEPQTIVRLLALIEIGTPFVPLHPGLTERERARQLAAVRPCVDLDRVSTSGDVPPAQPPSPDPQHPLAILFTSGATGSPRAVSLSREAFEGSASASAERLGWTENDRWLTCLPLAHVGGLSIVTRCLIARRTVVLASRFDPGAVAELIDQHDVSLISLVPTMLTRLLNLEPEWRPPPSLRAVLLGGGPVSDVVWNEAWRRRIPLRATYGLTETCSQVATGTESAPRDLLPLAGTEIRINAGCIEVRSLYMCSCTLTGEHCTSDGFLRTGDLGRLRSDGVLEVLGRADDLIITGGENVLPEDIEAELESHPQISRAVVFGFPDDEWGEIVAAALVADGVQPEAAEFREWCDGRLASFRRPRRISWLSELPETPTGKIDRPAVIEATAGRLEEL
jgi:O-succinylbenzoic acid--CoA ligase